jgi:hypothetical protein
MTEVLSRPSRPSTPRAGSGPAGTRRRRPQPAPTPQALGVVGVAAALRAAGLGILAVMVVVLVAWAADADSGAGAGEAVATALMAWLAAHHTHLSVPGGELALVPLGLTALPAALLHAATLRAGRAAGARSRRDVVALASSGTAAYAVVAALVALLARTSTVEALPVSAFAGAGVVAALSCGSAAVRAAGSWDGVARRLPPRVRTALPAAAGALGVLLAGGALLTALSLLAHRDRAAMLVDGLGVGVGGGVLLALLCLAYVPTAAVWGSAYVAGPGFAVGAATSVSPFGTDLGAVPAVPLLAALPQEPGPGWAPLVLLVPVAGGVLAGLLARRSPAPVGGGWRAVAGTAGCAGALVAGAMAGLALVASGPAGPGRLAETGPAWWAVGPAAGLEVALVMAATLLVLRRRG